MYELVVYEYPVQFDFQYLEKYDEWQEEYSLEGFINFSIYNETGYDLERSLEDAWYSEETIKRYNFNLIFNI